MSPEFILGFKELADELSADIVGDPQEDEHHGPEGDALQRTSTGLMVWRKRDNRTAFTNGHDTWLRGPDGTIHRRLNTELFFWEQDLPPSPLIEEWSSPNCWRGRPFGPPLAIVIHTEAGTEDGTREYFARASSQVSAHFGINLDGQVDRFVDLEDRAWHAGILERGRRWGRVYGSRWDGWRENPNRWTVGIETEDLGNPAQEVTEEQFDSVLAVARMAVERFPSIKWLLRHTDVSPVSRPNCPGRRWLGPGHFADVATRLGLHTLV